MTEVTGLLVSVDQLHENIEMLGSVLDGTYGDPKEAKEAVRQAPRVEDRLEEVGNGLGDGIAKIQGLRERLERLIAQF